MKSIKLLAASAVTYGAIITGVLAYDRHGTESMDRQALDWQASTVSMVLQRIAPHEVPGLCGDVPGRTADGCTYRRGTHCNVFTVNDTAVIRREIELHCIGGTDHPLEWEL